MTVAHHPTDPTLASFAAGALDEARGLVVATHVSLCRQCRNAVRAFECVGGALLDTAETTAMNDGALERAMAQLGRVEERVPSTPVAHVAGALPAPLAQYALGPWRRIGPRLQWRSVDVPSKEAVRVIMLKGAPGTRLPRHKHTGTEWTCVLEGAFRHDVERYGAGDFDEADETVEHHPVVEEGVACICLVALEGTLKLQSLMGRVLQPFIRI
jgi:putative transcriptional regulator